MDLQSPQYVKRTAHMFNLRYTSQLNETNPTPENIERNPSYLNVSRSVCGYSGYSCLSYNNGTSTIKTNNSSVTKLMDTTPKAPPYHPKTISGVCSELSTVFKSTSCKREEDESKEHIYNNLLPQPQPPPLPKSTSTSKYVSSITIGNSTNCTENGKSFIMQKIEKLYGSDAVSNPGLLLKRTSLSSEERIIPISVEGRNPGGNLNHAWKSHFKNEQTYSESRYTTKCATDPFNDNSFGTTDDCSGSNGTSKIDITEASDGNRILIKKDLPHYANGYGISSSSGHIVKDLNNGIFDKHNTLNTDANYTRKNGNFQSFVDSQLKREPIDVSGVVNYESPTCISPVDNTADDSTLGEDEVRLPLSVKIKPKPLPKPKDMALRRSSRNTDKTAAIISNKEEALISEEDRTDECNIKSAHLIPATSSALDSPATTKDIFDATNEVEATTSKENEEVVKNGAFFIVEMEKIKTQIEERIVKATKELELDDDPNSERAGRIRAAIGKANLLINKKFKQFHGLCEANLAEQKEKVDNKPFQTKNEDLAGFWDMVYIQVDEIFRMFNDLEGTTTESSANDQPDSVVINAVKQSNSPRKVGSQKSTSKSTIPIKKNAVSSRDESRRRLLAEKRRALKTQGPITKSTGEESDVHIFVPEDTQRS